MNHSSVSGTSNPSFGRGMAMSNHMIGGQYSNQRSPLNHRTYNLGKLPFLVAPLIA